MNEVRYRTAEVARFAEVTLRQLQVWEEKSLTTRNGLEAWVLMAGDFESVRDMNPQPTTQQIETWHIDRLVFYARNPRKNDAAVDRMCARIREFGFKVPVLARSDGTIVDGHLRIKAARKLGTWPGGDIGQIPIILCDEWSEAQVKAFRLMVNRSVSWADWDEELLSLELQELSAADFDLSLTGFNPGEIDGLLAIPDEERANAAPPLPENPVSRVGDLSQKHFGAVSGPVTDNPVFLPEPTLHCAVGAFLKTNDFPLTWIASTLTTSRAKGQVRKPDISRVRRGLTIAEGGQGGC